MPERWKQRQATWQFIRDVFLFFGGLTGVAIETVAYLKGLQIEPTLLILFAAMMGLPLVLNGPKKNGN